MNLRFFYFLLISSAIVNLTGCSDDDENVISSIVSSITLSEEVIDVEEPMTPVSFKGGKTLSFDVNMGSGAFHFKDDPDDEFYTITDRGPNIPCDDSTDSVGVENFCIGSVTDAGGRVIDERDNTGTIFASAEFTPTIYKFNIDTGGAIGAKVGYEVKQTITLMDNDNNPISGLPNPLIGMTTENGYDNQGNSLDFDPAGINPKAIVKLSNGTFWLAEEYAPSLVHVAANGRILERVVPIGVENSLADANYRVIGLLPAILKKRHLNRGIESLAISLDEQFLYFIMESPLANPDESAFSYSRYVRLFKISLQQGDLESVVGEYIYTLDEANTFIADNTSQQSDVKVSEMLALDTDELIILERVTRHTKLYRVSLDTATNILNSEWDIEALNQLSLSLETQSNLAVQGIMPLSKQSVFDSRSEISDLDSNIEGLTLLNDEYAVFINNNEFAQNGVKTRITVAKIVKQLNK